MRDRFKTCLYFLGGLLLGALCSPLYEQTGFWLFVAGVAWFAVVLWIENLMG